MGGSAAEFTEHFKKILKDENERNFPGNDYYEFYVVKSNMTALPEPQAYVAIHSMKEKEFIIIGLALSKTE